ncbi:tetratricopeptide repeat protein [Candidatus Midichloria mitochondrii]|uniref:tetratricopeptide repeat protein n=1 Tax=Candidatus Midichloria mitochondrii TaxID=234827 RepID=UPI0039773D3B
MSYNLAKIYHKNRNYTAAFLLYQQSLTIRESIFAEKSKEVADIYYHMAYLCKSLGVNATKTSRYWQKSLDIYKKIYEQ